MYGAQAGMGSCMGIFLKRKYGNEYYSTLSKPYSLPSSLVETLTPHPLSSTKPNFISLSLFPTLGIIFIFCLTWKLIATTHGRNYFTFISALTGFCIIFFLRITSVHRLSLPHLRLVGYLGCNRALVDLFHYFC